MSNVKRKNFQGVVNIIRFNWHLYALAIFAVISLLTLAILLKNNISSYLYFSAIFIIVINFISLGVSYYIYDLSDLYKFNFLDSYIKENKSFIINIHSGFDETTSLLKEKFPNSTIQSFDFYDEKINTELSIKRARKIYPSSSVKIIDNKLPISDNSVDVVCLIFALHEHRSANYRIDLLTEINRILINDGHVVVVEHLRDLNNFIAYTIGCFHFYSMSSWLSDFDSSNFKAHKIIKLNPFVTSFILSKNDSTS